MTAIAGAVATPSVVPPDMAVTMSSTDQGEDGGPTGHPAVDVGIPHGGGTFASYPLYVTTAGLLGVYGLTATAVAQDVDVLTASTDRFQLVNTLERGIRPKIRQLTTTGYTDVPNTLVTPAAMARHTWHSAAVGWFLQADHPITDQQLATVQALAADAGLTVEARRPLKSLSSLRTGAAAVGDSAVPGCPGHDGRPYPWRRRQRPADSDRDRRTPAGPPHPDRHDRRCSGAARSSSRPRRRLCQPGQRPAPRSRGLADAPVPHLAAIVVGLPLFATAAGWALAGWQPALFARRRLDQHQRAGVPARR
jgi:putative ABC transport system permease protein